MWRSLSALIVTASIAFADHIPVDRDPAKFFALGMRETRLKNLAIEAPGCSVGTNCAQPRPISPFCGILHAKNASIAEPGQAISDLMCTDGSELFVAFRNNTNGGCRPFCDNIAHAGLESDCTSTFTPPILDDLDQDGIPSCGDDCDTDRDDVAMACGVTLPLPACDPGRPVLVNDNEECDPIGLDINPGNDQCDLAAGVYGAIRVRNGGRLMFGGGNTTVCSLVTGKAVRVKSDGPATVTVPGTGSVKLSNLGDVGTGCNQLRIITERGTLRFGKFGDYELDACSIAGHVRLGHGNNLRGRFIADILTDDRGNDGRCCGPEVPPTTTTTSTSTTTLSSTTTSSTSVTTTTESSTTQPSTTVTTTTEPTTTDTTTTGPTTTGTTTTAPSTTTAPTTTATTTTSPTTTQPTTTITTTTSTTVTTTTLGGLFTRTPGFWKTHPDATQAVLTDSGGVNVCGRIVTDVHVNHAHSALEAMCVSPSGDQRLQLIRHLMAAALNIAADGAPFGDYASCNALCQNLSATAMQLANCIDSLDRYNNSGDNVPTPFDPGRANSKLCELAYNTACTLVSAASCSAP